MPMAAMDDKIAPTLRPPLRLTRPDVPPERHQKYRIQENDLDIMEVVGRLDCVAADDIHRYVGGSPKYLSDRLLLLWRQSFLSRPRAQYALLASFVDAGNYRL